MEGADRDEKRQKERKKERIQRISERGIIHHLIGFLLAIPDFAGACHAVKSALKVLPPGNYLTCKFLMALLDQVQRVSDKRKKSYQNGMSLCFRLNSFITGQNKLSKREKSG